MATMITSAVVAAEFNLDTEIANLMVGIGIPISLITVPLWHYFIFRI
jgi:predicted permease